MNKTSSRIFIIARDFYFYSELPQFSHPPVLCAKKEYISSSMSQSVIIPREELSNFFLPNTFLEAPEALIRDGVKKGSSFLGPLQLRHLYLEHFLPLAQAVFLGCKSKSFSGNKARLSTSINELLPFCKYHYLRFSSLFN